MHLVFHKDEILTFQPDYYKYHGKIIKDCDYEGTVNLT